MPIYTFYNKKTKKEFDEMMSIAEMEEYKDKNPHIVQRITGLNIVSGVGSIKQDGGWKENYVGSSGGMIVGFGRGIADEVLIFHWTGDIVLIE